MRNITELLGRTFPSQFVFPVLGHEDVQNSDYKDYKRFLDSLGNIWKQWLPTEALVTFAKGIVGNLHTFIIYAGRSKLISIDIQKL
jgi:sphingomyelin phosphodiesterase acid-like 3